MPCTVSSASLSSATVQAAIDAAVSGDVICLPPGTATWTTVVSIKKGITLRGAGAGGYVGRSATLVAVGTGEKTFTVTVHPGLSFVVGETITARYYDLDGANYMTGTVKSASGTTLVLTVGATEGSGTWPAWVFERPTSTTIVNSAVSKTGQGMIQVTESTVGSVEISGIHFTQGTGTLGAHISIGPSTGGKPVVVHDNWFSLTGSIYSGVYISGVNRGLVYRNSFNAALCSANGPCSVGIGGSLNIKSVTLYSSWSTPSTMGTADTDGTHNVYFEDNYLLAFWQAGLTPDSGARLVARHNTFLDSTMGWHGADTEQLGSRHWEIYDNEFVQSVMPSGRSFNLNWFVQSRGGTGVITDNIIPNIISQDYGDKSELTFFIYVLRRNTGGYLACWGATTAGIQYPVPRQNGMGYVTGAAETGPDGIYKGDSEPIYIWNNTGTYVVAAGDYGPNECGVDAGSIVDYFVSGRDYFLNAGAKPGWTKYTYPHPLRADRIQPPTNVIIRTP
jgi:hypothetical protein